MGDVSIERQFHGTVALMLLHLRRLAQSNDVDAGFAAGRELRMIDAGHEAFMRRCLALDDQLQAGQSPSESVTPELLEALRAHILRINSADPA